MSELDKKWSEFDTAFQKGDVFWVENRFERWKLEISELFVSNALTRRLNAIGDILELDIDYIRTQTYNETHPGNEIPLRDIGNEKYPKRFNIVKTNKLWAIIQDELYRINSNNSDIEDLEKLKLLKARQENPNFEKELADILIGGEEGNNIFPDMKLYEILDFEDNLPDFSNNYSFSTDKDLLTKLECSRIEYIHKIISTLFRKGRFKDKDIEIAKKYFKDWIESSIETNEQLKLSDVLGLNIKNELLFNKKTKTDDMTLNDKVDKSKDFFIKGDKQSALENLWDAFERMKTLLNPDKKESSNTILDQLSGDIERKIWEAEFLTLTDIGNDYQVRHFETNKRPITSNKEKEYLYFRMLSLIDFTLNKIQLTNKDSLIL
jgi:hypothetical protein